MAGYTLPDRLTGPAPRKRPADQAARTAREIFDWLVTEHAARGAMFSSPAIERL